MNNLEHKLAELEALLFIHGEPMTRQKIKKVLGVGEEDVKNIIGEMEKRLVSEDRGLVLVSDEEKIQLVTKPQFASIAAEFIKKELSEELTPAALEVVSLICYLGPISRSRLEYFRGVNSVFTLRNLLIRGLIERSPDEKNSNAYSYRVTFEFLKHLGLQKAEDLPDYAKFREILEKKTDVLEQQISSDAGITDIGSDA